jgi:hypothetical protein
MSRAVVLYCRAKDTSNRNNRKQSQTIVHCLCGGEEGLAHLANRFDLQSRASGGDGGRLVTRDAVDQCGCSTVLCLVGWLVP